jgi:integration host factor subunit beta
MANKMTRAVLIEEIARDVELTRKDSEMIIDAIFDSVVRALRAGDKVEIRGLGSFHTRQRQPRVGRNPKTGARVEVPAKRVPYFRLVWEICGAGFKEPMQLAAGGVEGTLLIV